MWVLVCYNLHRCTQATKERLEQEWNAGGDLANGAVDEKQDDGDGKILRTYANGMQVELEEL